VFDRVLECSTDIISTVLQSMVYTDAHSLVGIVMFTLFVD